MAVFLELACKRNIRGQHPRTHCRKTKDQAPPLFAETIFLETKRLVHGCMYQCNPLFGSKLSGAVSSRIREIIDRCPSHFGFEFGERIYV